MKLRMAVIAGSLAVAGCGSGADDILGGGDAGYCAKGFNGGTSEWGCTSCGGVDPLDDRDDFAVAIDNDADTFREFTLGSGSSQMTITVRAPAGRVFPAGGDAGALIRFPQGVFASMTLNFTTYRNGAPVDAAGDTQPAQGEKSFFSLTPSGEFDTLRATIQLTGASDSVPFRVYEFCGDK